MSSLRMWVAIFDFTIEPISMKETQCQALETFLLSHIWAIHVLSESEAYFIMPWLIWARVYLMDCSCAQREWVAGSPGRLHKTTL